MNILTISTADWVGPHLERWVRRVKESNPGAMLGLLYVTGDGGEAAPSWVRDEFFDVKVYPAGTFGRVWVNEVRMGACGIFGWESCIYCDADADIVGDLGGIAAGGGGEGVELACCRSPVVHSAWWDIARKFDYEFPDRYYNNGLLWMARDWNEEWTAAVNKLVGVELPERIMGTLIFNVMLNENVGKWFELGKEYQAIWWEGVKLRAAKVVQYCNDGGQDKRVELERLRRAVL